MDEQLQRTILLASFIRKIDLENVLQKIKKNFVVVGSKIFMLNDKNDENKCILTYNINLDGTDNRVDFDKYIPGTISLHRKKETNTLYTLNALNEIVKQENNGELDKTFVIDWSKYTNCILISKKNDDILKIETELNQILDFSNI